MIKATLFAAILFLTSFNLYAAESVHGVLRVVKGDVQIKAAKDGQKTKARLGGKVFPQDTIITGKDARVKIVMTDNNEINVSPDSQMIIQNYVYNPEKGQKDVLLNVIYGKVRSKVEQKYDGKTSKFQVKTPSAVAGVRGTDFMTSFNKKNGATQVVTFKGKVEFGAPGPNGTIAGAVMVQPGQTSTAAAGQTPQPPTEMPKEQLAKADTETKAEERTPAQQQQSPGNEDSKSETDKKEEPKGEQKNEQSGDAKNEGNKDSKDQKDPNNKENKDRKEQAKQDPKDAPKDSAASGDTAKSDAKSDGTAKSPNGGSTASTGTTKESGDAKQGSTGSGNGDGSRSGGASTGSTTGTKAPAPGGTAAGGGGTSMPGREPSSAVGGSMLNPSDLPSSATGPAFTSPTGFQPIMPPLTELPRCDFCNSVIQNGSQKITIKVQTQ